MLPALLLVTPPVVIVPVEFRLRAAAVSVTLPLPRVRSPLLALTVIECTLAVPVASLAVSVTAAAVVTDPALVNVMLPPAIAAFPEATLRLLLTCKALGVTAGFDDAAVMVRSPLPVEIAPPMVMLPPVVPVTLSKGEVVRVERDTLPPSVVSAAPVDKVVPARKSSVIGLAVVPTVPLAENAPEWVIAPCARRLTDIVFRSAIPVPAVVVPPRVMTMSRPALAVTAKEDCAPV